MVTAAPGAKPGAAQARQVTITANVESVDATRQVVLLQGPGGRYVEAKIKDPAVFKTIKPGDKIDATYTEAVLIEVWWRPGSDALQAVNARRGAAARRDNRTKEAAPRFDGRALRGAILAIGTRATPSAAHDTGGLFAGRTHRQHRTTLAGNMGWESGTYKVTVKGAVVRDRQVSLGLSQEGWEMGVHPRYMECGCSACISRSSHAAPSASIEEIGCDFQRTGGARVTSGGSALERCSCVSRFRTCVSARPSSESGC